MPKINITVRFKKSLFRTEDHREATAYVRAREDLRFGHEEAEKYARVVILLTDKKRPIKPSVEKIVRENKDKTVKEIMKKLLEEENE